MAGRYKILEELGSGGAGAVYKAFDTQLDRYVAIKRLLSKEDAEKDVENSDRLQKEAASLATLQHPNIVSVFDIASDEKGFFMVMELLEGETLADWIENHPLGLKDFYELATQILEAVLTAHHQSILHRDLKPENIKITRLPGGRLQAKVLDFGLARIMKGARRKMTEDQDGNVTGSIYYMAPEQLRRQPVDERTDLYALGCLFYHALAGRKPFDAETLTEVVDLHINHQVYPLQEVAPLVPSAIADWVMWLFNVDPDTRPQSAQQALEFVKELHQWGHFKSEDDEEIAMPIMEDQEFVAVAVAAVEDSPAIPTPLPVGGKKLHRVDPNNAGTPISAAPAYSSAPAFASGEPPVSTLGLSPSAEPFNPPKQGLPKWVIPTAVIASAIVGGGFYMSNKRAAEETAKAEQAKVTSIVRPSNLYMLGNVVNYLSSDKTFADPDPKAEKLAQPGQTVAAWGDLENAAGDAILKTPDNKAESQPTLQKDAMIPDFRPLISSVLFETGDALVSRVDKKMDESKSMPFGSATKSKGITVVTLLKANVTDKPLNCFQVKNQDNKASITFSAAPKGEGAVIIELGKVKKEVKFKGVDWTKHQLVTLTWDGGSGRASVTLRNPTGTKVLADSAAPKYTGPDPLNEIRLSGVKANDSFLGEISEFSVWGHSMKAPERNQQEWRYAQYLFAKPGARF